LIQIPRPEYPRPQLRRQDRKNLNGEWSFVFDDSDVGYPVIMAGSVLASILVLIIFYIAQRYIIEGVSRSGIKG
jgi:ABC-type glycerol-3-phosphate transport system permease component